jgi:hypothetical protein
MADGLGDGGVSRIDVSLKPAFYFGGDAVLVAMDGDGLKIFHEAVAQALLRDPQQPLDLVHGDVTHTFSIDPEAAVITLDSQSVSWRLPISTLTDMLPKLDALGRSSKPGHHYVDLDGPADTLVLSLNEYP